MKIKVLDRQSILDVAIQSCGSMEAAFDFALQNNLSISDVLRAETGLETSAVVDKNVVARYSANRTIPATELSLQDIENAPYGGIGYMGIEIDFKVSDENDSRN